MSADVEKLRAEAARLREANARLMAQQKISERLLGAKSLEEVADIALSTIRQWFGAQGGAIALAARSEVGVGSIRQYSSADGIWSALPEGARGGLLEILKREHASLAAAEASSFLVERGLPAAEALKNFLAMPLRLREECLGAVVLYNFLHPENLERYMEEIRALLLPVSYAVSYVCLMDLTHKEARLLEAILENTNSHLAYLDRDFNFLRVNSAYEKGSGHSREELIGRSHFDFFPNPENEAIFARVRDTGLPVEHREKPFEYADQPERGITYWDWILTPLKDEAGEVEGLVLSLTDLTENVQTRERLLAAERERARLAESLAAEVNHRMKNNLTMVAGLLQLQISEEPDEARAAAIMRDAIGRIRTFAAVHEQLYERHAESLELLDAMRRIAEMNCEALTRGSVELSVEGESAAYPPKTAMRICVAANELITNAIKHGAPGPDGRLQLKIRVGMEEGRLVLSVWNSGNPVAAGFDVQKQARMGLRLIEDVAIGQYGGTFSLTPHEGGTLARMIIDDERLREEE